jgi:tetratricopeptide (TPR) repeat protein
VSKIATEITVIIDGCNSGSGVLYKREGNTYSVLTAKHTVDKSDAICLVIAPDGTRYRADSGKVTVPVPGVDLAVQTFNSDKTYKLAKWGDSEKATAGKIVYVADTPAPSEAIPQGTLVMPDGEIVGRAKQPSEGYTLIYNNPTLRGMSGGPVLDEQGRVIGIHGEGDRENGEKTGSNLGIPIQMFLKPDSQMAKNTQPEPAKDATAHFSQGFALEKRGDLKGALAEYSQAIAIDPNYALAYNNRGLVRYDLGDKRAALADYNQAIRINRKYAEAYNNRGVVRYDLGDKQAALADYNQAIGINPNLAPAYYNRGLVRYDLGNKQAALADYNQALRMGLNYAPAYYNRGLVRYELGDKQAALADYTEAIGINPNLAPAYYNRGLVRYELGDKPAAIADYNEAIRINPNAANAYYNRGLVRRDRGNKQGAREDFQKAADLYRQQGNQKWYQHSLNNLKALSE